MSKSFYAIVLLISLVLYACGGKTRDDTSKGVATFPKGSTQDLNYDTASKILSDMQLYTTAVKKLDNSVLQKLDQNYQNVSFKTEQKPLFINVYPDPSGARIIFLLAQKEPTTGTNYLLTFDKKLPVIDSEMVELQIRTRDPEKPLTCSMTVQDTAAYMAEYTSHQLVAQYQLKKQFLQSGTYDFDALTIPSYRQRGYAFITFDLMKAEVKDQTGNLAAPCVDQ